jgi:hypothetical protein
MTSGPIITLSPIVTGPHTRQLIPIPELSPISICEPSPKYAPFSIFIFLPAHLNNDLVTQRLNGLAHLPNLLSEAGKYRAQQ